MAYFEGRGGRRFGSWHILELMEGGNGVDQAQCDFSCPPDSMVSPPPPHPSVGLPGHRLERSHLLPHLHSCQTHGSLLRLNQVTPADSGQYVCQVVGGSVPLEATVLVTIEPASSVPGEWYWAEGRARHTGFGRTCCSASTHETNSSPITHDFLPLPGIDPLPSVSALGVTPPVRIESSSSHLTEGQTLDLNCLVSGQAHAQVTWHKRRGSLPAQHQVGRGATRITKKKAYRHIDLELRPRAYLFLPRYTAPCYGSPT